MSSSPLPAMWHPGGSGNPRYVAKYPEYFRLRGPTLFDTVVGTEADRVRGARTWCSQFALSNPRPGTMTCLIICLMVDHPPELIEPSMPSPVRPNTRGPQRWPSTRGRRISFIERYGSGLGFFYLSALGNTRQAQLDSSISIWKNTRRFCSLLGPQQGSSTPSHSTVDSLQSLLSVFIFFLVPSLMYIYFSPLYQA